MAGTQVRMAGTDGKGSPTPKEMFADGEMLVQQVGRPR